MNSFGMMEDTKVIPSVDAILFPSDDRPPRLVSLATSPAGTTMINPPAPYRCGRTPHPEMFMDYIAEEFGTRAWNFHVSILY